MPLGYEPVGGFIGLVVIVLALSAAALGIASAAMTFAHDRPHVAAQPA
jgi:hypothetical protein